MKLRTLITTAIILSHASAMSAGSNCNLQSNGVQRQVAEFTDLIKPANVMSDKDEFGNADGRGSLTEKAGELGLTTAEVSQISQSTGYVVCPASMGKNPTIASAALVGSNMQIVTAAHVFYDELGNERTPLGECYFRNQGDPYTLILLDFDSGSHRIGKTGVIKANEPNDYAVVRLKSPVAEATPFAIDSNGLEDQETMVGIAAHQKSPTREFPADQPVVQQCRNRQSEKPAGAPTQYYTDCDLSPLGSGGVVLTRNPVGALAVAGIFTATGHESKNGQPYNFASKSYTRVVGLDAVFATDVTEVRSSIPPRTANLK